MNTTETNTNPQTGVAGIGGAAAAIAAAASAMITSAKRRS
ncbi:MAG: NPXTG-anchored protein [Oscillospiraceae bacterium]